MKVTLKDLNEQIKVLTIAVTTSNNNFTKALARIRILESKTKNFLNNNNEKT